MAAPYLALYMTTDFDWPHRVIVPIRLFAESRHTLSDATKTSAFFTDPNEAEKAANRVIASNPFQLWVLLEPFLPAILNRRAASVTMNKLMSQLNAALNPTAPVMGPPQITVQIAFGMKRRAPSPYGGDFVDSKIFERGRSFRLEARHAKLRILPPVVFNGAVIMALQFVRPDQIAHGWY